MWTGPKTFFGQVYCSLLSYVDKKNPFWPAVLRSTIFDKRNIFLYIRQFLYMKYIYVEVYLKPHGHVKAFKQFNTCRLSSAAEEP